MIAFRVPPAILPQLDSDALQARALIAGVRRLVYIYDDRQNVIRCDRESVEIIAEVLVDLGERAADRETRVGAMRAAKAALDALR